MRGPHIIGDLGISACTRQIRRALPAGQILQALSAAKLCFSELVLKCNNNRIQTMR